MVRNEKYVGDALFQKYYTDDNFNRRRNKGECNQYFATNHHDQLSAAKLLKPHRLS